MCIDFLVSFTLPHLADERISAASSKFPAFVDESHATPSNSETGACFLNSGLSASAFLPCFFFASKTSSEPSCRFEFDLLAFFSVLANLSLGVLISTTVSLVPSAGKNAKFPTSFSPVLVPTLFDLVQQLRQLDGGNLSLLSSKTYFLSP
ncbi:unnamed protein product [Linum trigynum]|uniref:Uncharacterized protein n=1 Tax=Linum trigynum TaxID=586398 RepID=A0AAV2E3A4_9ROSI